MQRITYSSVLNSVYALSNARYYWLFFFLTSAFIFSPFFLQLHFIVSTNDNVFNHYPNLLYGYRAMRAGNFGLWNPYIFSGSDFTTSMHNHMLNPFNWYLLLFPEKYLFQAVTLKFFIEYSLIGIFAFKIYNLYCEKISSLFIAIVTQLCGFTWFTTTTFIGTDLFLFDLMFIYLILTANQRRTITNFILMTCCAFGIFIVGHVGYITAFEIPLIIVFIISCWKQFPLQRREIILTFLFANLIGLMLAAYRLVPITLSLFHDQAIQTIWPPDLGGNNAYFILSGFIPEVFGITAAESTRFFHLLGVEGRHTQFHNLLYFGIAPMFLILMAAMGNFGKYARLLGLIGLGIALTHMFLMQPLSDVINFMMLPFIHDIVQRTAYPFLFLACLLLSLKHISKADAMSISDNGFRSFIVLIGFIISAMLTVWIKNLATHSITIAHWSTILLAMRGLLVFSLVGSIYLAWNIPLTSVAGRKLTNWALLIFVLGICGWTLHIIINHATSWLPTRDLAYMLGESIWIVITINLLRNINKNKSLPLIFLLGIVICLIILLVPLAGPWNGSLNQKTAFTVLFGSLIFIIIAATCWELFISFSEKKISFHQFMGILVFLTVGELLFFTKIYSYVGERNFTNLNYLYPTPSTSAETQIRQMDLQQYRVNDPNKLLDDPWGTQFSSVPMVYNIRTYGGVDSVVNSDLKNFLISFQNPDATWLARMGVMPLATNSRLLDLLGVRYNFMYKGNAIVRPKALARLSAFTDYKTISNTQAQIQLLKNARFDPTKTVLLSGNPGWDAQSRNLLPFYPVNFSSTNSDQIDATLKLKSPTIILFGDSYSSSWHARWNGKPIPIYLADGNFMAMSLPVGEGHLSLEFKPTLFFFLVKISLLVAIFMATLILYRIFFYSLRSRNETP